MIALRILGGLAGLAGVAFVLQPAGSPAHAAVPAAAVAPAAPATSEVAVLAHPVARGDLLTAADFVFEQRPVAQARGALAAGQAVGQESLRNLAAGMVVRSSDLVAPRLVRRGEPVTILVRTGGLIISTQGRALGSGGAGDLVRVVASTNRTLDGIVDGPGAVRIAAP